MGRERCQLLNVPTERLPDEAVAVRSRSQHSTFAVSHVSLSSSGDSMNNSNHELLTSQTDLTRQCLLNHST